MIDGVRNWIVGIVSVLIFITAIEMILPDNSLKKYAKFVFGIIITITVMMPIISFIYKGPNEFEDNIRKYVDQSDNTFLNGAAEYSNSTFDTGMNKSIERVLSDKYPDYNFSVDYDGEVDQKDYSVVTDSIVIKVLYKGVKPIQKVDISNEEKEVNKQFDEIKDYVSEILKVERDKIKVIEMER